MAQELRLLVAAGGTGGHFFPAVAVVQEAERLGPVRACFVGRADRIEGQLAPRLGYQFVPIPMWGVAGIGNLRTYGLPFAMLRSLATLRRVVRRVRPHVVFATGAYVSVPAGLLAGWYGLPLVLLEINLVPGRAVRFLARWARVIVTAWEGTAEYFPESIRGRVRCLGAPVRRMFWQVPSPSQARRQLGLDPERATVAVVGGSLGAQRLNAVAQRLMPAVAAGRFQLLWQSGRREVPRDGLPSGVVVREFFEDPALVFAAADCVVARAGGMTLAELCAVGRAAIVVPYPGATEQHQRENARWMEQHGAALCVEDAEAEAVVPVLVEQLLQDPMRREQMAEAARRLARPQAAVELAALLWQFRR